MNLYIIYKAYIYMSVGYIYMPMGYIYICLVYRKR